MLKRDQISDFFLTKKKLKFKNNKNKKKKNKLNFSFKINNNSIKKKYVRVQNFKNIIYFKIKNLNIEKVKITNLDLMLYLDRKLLYKLKEKLYLLNSIIMEIYFSKNTFFIIIKLLLYDVKTFNLKQSKKKYLVNLRKNYFFLDLKGGVYFFLKKNKFFYNLEIWEKGKNSIYTFWSNISLKI